MDAKKAVNEKIAGYRGKQQWFYKQWFYKRAGGAFSGDLLDTKSQSPGYFPAAWGRGYKFLVHKGRKVHQVFFNYAYTQDLAMVIM